MGLFSYFKRKTPKAETNKIVPKAPTLSIMSIGSGFYYITADFEKPTNDNERLFLIREFSAMVSYLQTGQLNAGIKQSLDIRSNQLGEPQLSSQIGALVDENWVNFLALFKGEIIKNIEKGAEQVVMVPSQTFRPNLRGGDDD